MVSISEHCSELAEPIVMPFGRLTWLGPRIRLGPHPEGERAIFGASALKSMRSLQGELCQNG